MSYHLNRVEGELLSTLEFKLPRSNEKVSGEIRKHTLTSGEFFAIWYYSDGWKIFIAGDCAKRYLPS